MQELCILHRQDIDVLILLIRILALNGDLSKCHWFIKTPKASLNSAILAASGMRTSDFGSALSITTKIRMPNRK